MPRRPSITIIGAGRFGSALAQLLKASGYQIREIVTRAGRKPSTAAVALARKTGSVAVPLNSAKLDAEVLWLCVGDDGLATCAAELAERPTSAKFALHSSGALASDVLAPLRKRGLAVAAGHPLMSFVAGVPPSLNDVLFAIEGDRVAAAIAAGIAKDLGGVPFTIKKQKKALYHAFGAFSSPLLIAHFSTAESLARAAGVPAASIRRAMRPIVERTLENYFAGGGAAAFSGPLVRGDAETIRRHLEALRAFPAELAVYVALVRQALESPLPVANKPKLRRLLKSG